ncbi:hypothetical protein FRC12_003675 [Ceratobasidium sp. 428]|nr:hypothetical protein FRC12_003675 [Ceratobasidium sp. 428]
MEHPMFTMLDIVLEIILYLSNPERARLLTVNSTFFYAGVRFVWRKLTDFPQLFAVLDKPTNIPDGYRSPVQITVQEKALIGPRWERFSLYTRCVRELSNLDLLYARPVLWSGLQQLLSLPPVAPNLRKIVFAWRTNGCTGDLDLWDIARVFLGPSTSILRCYGDDVHPGLSVDRAGRVLKRAQTVGCNLTDLTLLTDPPGDEEEIATLARRISTFERLSQLRLSPQLVTGTMLDCLHNLPNLEQLTFSTPIEGRHESRWRSLEIEDGYTEPQFPHLRRLVLSGISCLAIGHLFNTRPLMLQNITLLHVHMSSHRGRESVSPESTAKFFILVSAHGSRIENLTVVWPNNLTQPFTLFPRLLPCLFRLNLRSLALHNVCFPPESAGISLIHGHWPLLSHLVIPHQVAWPWDMVQLTERPALKVLHLDFQAVEWRGKIRRRDSTTPIQLCSQFEIGVTGEEDMRRLASFVSSEGFCYTVGRNSRLYGATSITGGLKIVCHQTSSDSTLW